MNTINIPGVSPWILALIVLWTIPWKGIALWKSARLSHKWWFIVLLILNTVGILEIIYIFLIARKYTVETIEKPEQWNNVTNGHVSTKSNFGTGTPNADVASADAPPSPADVEPHRDSFSQTVKTTETKTVMTTPTKESPKVEAEKSTEETESESSEK